MDDSPFALRGALEGFYGTYYTFPERNDMVRFLGKHGFNFYMYCPKNDRQHRMQWRVPYPDGVMEDFAETLSVAEEAGVTFCYAISFGVPIRFDSSEDLDTVITKLGRFQERGCRAFGVLLDDIAESWINEVDGTQFRSAAHAHSDFVNRLYDWVMSQGDNCTLYLCPPDYCGTPPFSPYLEELGRELAAGIEIFYTGPDVCSMRIDRGDARAFGDALCRKPVIWDNYPVNDLKMRPQMHIGPLRGRDPHLYQEVNGFCSNLMGEAEASKVALLTIADYLHRPDSYDPDEAWHRALLEVGGDESYPSLRKFAENSLRSPLQRNGAPVMTRLAGEALSALRQTNGQMESTPVIEFAAYLDALDVATYHLKNRMRNLALRQNLLPWIEALDEVLWLGRGALRIFAALERGVDPAAPVTFTAELLADVRGGSKRIGGTGTVELAEYALERAARYGQSRQPGEGSEEERQGTGSGDASPSSDHTDLRSTAG